MVKHVILPVSFTVPFILLYYLDPQSFNATWKGRAFYLFFLYFVFLELIMSWEEITQKSIFAQKTKRIIALALASTLPTIFIIVNFLFLKTAILELGSQIKGILFRDLPLSIEYLVLTLLFVGVIWLAYNKKGLKLFLSSLFFIGTIGGIYTIDALFPFGVFTPFQIFVPITASVAAQVLAGMGYNVHLIFYADSPNLPKLQVSVMNSDLEPSAAKIAWPCAGVQSFLVYTFSVLIFLRRTLMPTSHKIIYFILGAAVTFFTNIFRIVNYFLIDLHQGHEAARLWHDYYGGLYSITWIAIYPLIIIGSQLLWIKIRHRNDMTFSTVQSNQ